MEASERGYAKPVTDAVSRSPSVMVRVLVVGVEPITLFVCSVSERSRTIRFIRRGENLEGGFCACSLTRSRYVEMLEHQQLQLVAGLQELYRRLKAGEGWTGSPLKETTRGTPLTHDILESLGALKQDNHASSDHFEDNLESLQSRLLATGASFMQRELSFDANSEADQSPIFESVSHHQIPTFTNPFAMNRFPPTPPMGSPHPSIIKTTSRLRTQLQTTTAPSTDMSWRAEPYEFINDIDFNMSYESPVTSVNLQAMNMTAQMYHDSTGMGINPCLTMKDWQPQDDQIQHYFQNGVFT